MVRFWRHFALLFMRLLREKKHAALDYRTLPSNLEFLKLGTQQQKRSSS